MTPLNIFTHPRNFEGFTLNPQRSLMTINTYEHVLDFWAERTNYESIGLPTDPRAFSLDRMHSLLRHLGHPEQRLKIIHVAGTKGKGSTSAMLASILRQAGYRTGLFTSPHLVYVEERVQVDGQPISRADLTQCMRRVARAVEAVESEHRSGTTFFEIITALGFLHFAEVRADFAVVEVGLGGRLDSTNVCTPLVSVITSISLDHVLQLGNTLPAIATEKAGIIKPGRPVISGATHPEAAEVISQIASERGVPLATLGVDFQFRYRPGRVSNTQQIQPRVTVTVQNEIWPELELPLFGEHQAANAAIAIACVSELRRNGVFIPLEAVRDGLAQVQWPARLEIVSQSPLVVLDCAHNVASIQAAVEALKTTFSSSRQGLIFACSRDKDWQGMLAELVPRFQRVWFTRYANSARSAQPEELAAFWQQCGGGSCEVVSTPAEALHAAQAWAQPDDLICGLGSVFLAGELRSAIPAKTETCSSIPEGITLATAKVEPQKQINWKADVSSFLAGCFS